jgi:hypothetical protein
MHVAIDLPDDIAQQLQTGGPDMPRHVLESVALEAYRARLLGESQIRRLLGFETRYEVHGFLNRPSGFRRRCPQSYRWLPPHRVSDLKIDGQPEDCAVRHRERIPPVPESSHGPKSGVTPGAL